MDQPAIPSRELPLLDPPLDPEPHCFHRRPLPSLTTDEARQISRFTLSPVTSNLRGSLDLSNDADADADADAESCEPSSEQPSTRKRRLEIESSQWSSPGLDDRRVPARVPTENDTRRFYPSACTPAAPAPWDQTSSSAFSNATERPNLFIPLSRGVKRSYFHVYENDGAPNDADPRKKATRSQPFVVAPYLLGREEAHATTPIPCDPSRSKTSPIARTSFIAPVPSQSTDKAIPTFNVSHYEPIQTSGYPSRYSEFSVKAESAGSFEGGGWRGGGREGREGDDRWQGRDSAGDEKSGDGGGGDDDDDDDDDKEGDSTRKKVPKKTPMACHFCRRRKLKCDGGRPTCSNCARRSLACAYDENVRRRGPGRKNKMQQQELAQHQQPQASSSTTSLASTLPMYSEAAPQVFSLPPPPRPSYDFPLGRIPGRREELGMGQRPPQAGPSNVYQQQQGQHEIYSQQAQQAGHGQAYQQSRPQQSQHGQQQYAHGYAHAQGPGYPSQAGPSAYTGRLPAAEGESEYLSEDDDDEGTSDSRSKRRASSPAEDIDPARRQRRREDDNRG